jgi:protein-L-isoaspartate(D-aspartate) O-methyltransferase
MKATIYYVLTFMLACTTSSAMAADKYQKQRQEMMAAITAEVENTASHLDGEQLEPGVLKALQETPRHEFVPPSQRKHAYENRPLPIGHGQTISQPYIVAIMTDLMNLEPGDQVLEVGTGSGYQAAIASQLVDKVYTIEIIEPLGKAARKRLKRLGHDNIEVRLGDGYYGWEEHAPFDAIIVTAAASHVPPPLIRQLKPGGRLIVPVGSRFMMQQLLLVEKDSKGEIHTRQVLPVRFVPLTGRH